MIRLLHLSDLHLCDNTHWDADPVLAALVARVREDVAAGLVPDLVAITGDLTQSGRPDEYRLAETWLADHLWPALTPEGGEPLPRERLLLVPGNHDCDWGRISRGARGLHRELLEQSTAEQLHQLIADLLNDGDDRASLLKRHAPYLDFYGAWLGNEQTAPWWQRDFHIGDRHIHIAGLDSAWVSSDGGDRGRLLLGRPQLHATGVIPAAAGAHWRLALLHHPWDYLAEHETEATQGLLHLHRDLILRGHRHSTAAHRSVPADPKRACVELAAGCVYQSSHWPNAYQWIELLDDPRRVRVHFRAWIDDEWRPDLHQAAPDAPPTDQIELPVDVQPTEPAPNPALAAPPLPDPGCYLENLYSRTGWIDIRGLVTGRTNAHRFPIGELYIELTTGGTADEQRTKPDTDLRRPEAMASRPLRDALRHPRLAVIGDPGCGKTTFLRWIGHCLASDALGHTRGLAAERLGLSPAPTSGAQTGGEPPANQAPRLPVLVSIAAWLAHIERCRHEPGSPAPEHAADWLLDHCAAEAAAENLGLNAAAFRAHLDAGRAMLLLDGLDEAPDQRGRERAVALIERLARAWPDCPMVVTSRPAALQGRAQLAGFAHTEVQPLAPAAIDAFLSRWSAALHPDDPRQASRHQAELAAALASRREIRRLARNAVMLTALAVVHWNQKRLPEQRAELYEAIIRWLTEARPDRPGREPPRRCRQLLAELALAMQTAAAGRQVQVPRRWAAEQIAHRFPTGDKPGDGPPVDRAEAFLAAEEIDSGIIVRRGHALRFWHLSFQDHLCAEALAGLPDQDRNACLLAVPAKDAAEGPDARPVLYADEWREPLLLLAGVLHQQGAAKVDGLIAAMLDQLGPAPATEPAARAVGLIGRLAQDLAVDGFSPADPRWPKLLKRALAVFDPDQAETIPIPERIAAADALALAGDPRLRWTDPARWVALPCGLFLMGAQQTDPAAAGYDQDAYDDESPPHQVEIGPLRIARWPVTVADFADFLDDDPADPRWWQAGGGAEDPKPDDWDDQLGHPSRPVTGVSWYQAMAYCAWLDARLRAQAAAGIGPELPDDACVRLPTEAEWEYTARGEAGRRYPWGDEPPTPGRANYAETKGVNDPSPVGIFPGDCTPDGIMDLAGNVREWCLDAWDEHPYAARSGDTPVRDPLSSGEAGSPRVQRGGGFWGRSRFLRATGRYGGGPGIRGQVVGFRVVLAPRRQH